MSKEINIDYKENSDESSKYEDQADSDYKSKSNRKIEDFLNKISIGNYEITINNIKPKDPVEILEKLYPIKNNDTLSNEEKNKQVQEIINKYME